MTPADDRPHLPEVDDDPDAGPRYVPPTPKAETAYLRVLNAIDLENPGPSVSAEAVRAWIESKGTENESPMPTPE